MSKQRLDIAPPRKAKTEQANCVAGSKRTVRVGVKVANHLVWPASYKILYCSYK